MITISLNIDISVIPYPPPYIQDIAHPETYAN